MTSAALPRRLLALAALCLTCLMPAFPPAVSAADKPLVLAVHPYLPVPEIERRFAPFADYLGKALGRPVSVRVGKDYQEHVEAVGRDQVDVAFLGPVPYVKVLAGYGRKPLLARFEVEGRPDLRGVVLVRQESAFKTLRDLKGRRFAFGDPESTMSHIMPRIMLLEAGVPAHAFAEHRFLGSHHNVVLAVLAGDFDAGAVKQEVFDEFASKGLRALAITPSTPDHVFVARSDLPAQDVTRLREAMLGLKAQPGGAALLDRMHKGLTALIPAAEADYDRLRATVRAVETATR